MILLFGCALVCLMVHFPMLASGLRLTQADLLDSRFNHYLLEHSYLWLNHDPNHASFWNAPFEYPAPNVLAYSDVMICFAPPYWAWRAVGFLPDTAFQLWMLTVAAINFLMAFFVLRRGMRFRTAGAWCGAVLFAAMGSRAAQLEHQQLYCQFYVLLTLYALIRLFNEGGVDIARLLPPLPPGEGWGEGRIKKILVEPSISQFPLTPALSRGERGQDWRFVNGSLIERPTSQASPSPARWIILAGAGLALQFWGGFYMGFFLLLTIAIGFTWAMILPASRRRLREVMTGRAWAILIVTAVGMSIALAPLAIHYLQVARAEGKPDDAAVTAMLPTPKSWLYMGPDSLLYGRLQWAFDDQPVREELAIGVGFLTLIAAAMGFSRGRRQITYKLLGAVTLTVIILATRIHEHSSLWWHVRSFVPGAFAIRAVARIGLLLAIPVAVGLARFVDRFNVNWPARLALLIVPLCFLEQIHHNARSYDKFEMREEVSRISSAIPRDSVAFFYTGKNPERWPLDQVTAMWASIQSGIPTINGYSGSLPRAERTLITTGSAITPGNEQGTRLQLLEWLSLNQMNPASVAWIADRHPPISPAQPIHVTEDILAQSPTD
jgi:hypothetical protein